MARSESNIKTTSPAIAGLIGLFLLCGMIGYALPRLSLPTVPHLNHVTYTSLSSMVDPLRQVYAASKGQLNNNRLVMIFNSSF